MTQILTNEKWYVRALVQVMPWCRQAKSTICANVDPDLCRHMMSLDHNELMKFGICSYCFNGFVWFIWPFHPVCFTTMISGLQSHYFAEMARPELTIGENGPVCTVMSCNDIYAVVLPYLSYVIILFRGWQSLVATQHFQMHFRELKNNKSSFLGVKVIG